MLAMRAVGIASMKARASSMVEAPRKAVSRRWRRHVFDARGRIDNRAYVFAVLEGFVELRFLLLAGVALVGLGFIATDHMLRAGASVAASRAVAARSRASPRLRTTDSRAA